MTGAVDSTAAAQVRPLAVAAAITLTLGRGLREVLDALQVQTTVMEQMRDDSLELFALGRKFDAVALVPIARRPLAVPVAVPVAATTRALRQWSGDADQ